jgi:hypothetical protein
MGGTRQAGVDSLRMESQDSPEFKAIQTPPGKRKPGRPKGTWRRPVVDQKRENLNKTWHDLKLEAQGEAGWRPLVDYLPGDYFIECWLFVKTKDGL